MTQVLYWIATFAAGADFARAEIVLTPPKVYSGAVYTGKGTTEIILPSNARPSNARPAKPPADNRRSQKNKPPLNKTPPGSAQKGYTEIIDSAIAMHRGDFKACFERQAKLNSDLQGLVVVQFSISEYGKVLNAVVKSSTLKHAKVERCVLDSIAAIGEFPQPGNGITLEATYPFNFVVRAVR